jgi:glyoxylate reductase
MQPRVFVTFPLPASAASALRRVARVETYRGPQPVPRAALLAGVRSADGLLCLLTERIDAALLSAAPRLRAVANYAVGYNNVDLDAADARGVVVTNTPDVLTETSADLAFALMLAAARRIAEGDRLVRSGRWRGWEPDQLLGQDVHGATLGIVGLGRIGGAVARRARGFGMRILYWNRRRLRRPPAGARYASLPTLLAAADFVSIHVPLTDATRHLIGRRELGRMKRTAILVNTSRGPVVDEAALTAALARRRIAAAGSTSSRTSRTCRGVASAAERRADPHIGSATTATRTAMAMLAVRNLTAALAGREPPNRVRPAAAEQSGSSPRTRRAKV